MEIRDHPHGCGEKAFRAPILGHQTGSSPRVWGKALINEINTRKDWIIPTGVGKSVLSSLNVNHNPDHPHGCGEKLFT